MVKIFISHSSQDRELAGALEELLRSALNLRGAEILCTSVEGSRLAGGADTDEELRDQILKAPAFIGLLSRASVESAYVLFELGARWGAKGSLIPLLAPGSEVSILKGPLAGLSALRADNVAQLHQLLSQLAKELGGELESAAAYQKHIDRMVILVSPVVEEEQQRLEWNAKRRSAVMAVVTAYNELLLPNAEERACIQKIHFPAQFLWKYYATDQEREWGQPLSEAFGVIATTADEASSISREKLDLAVRSIARLCGLESMVLERR